jgi:hypothetical protein
MLAESRNAFAEGEILLRCGGSAYFDVGDGSA